MIVQPMRCAVALIVSCFASRAALAGNVELVSRAVAFDDTGSDASGFPSLSADGRYVAFQSRALNLAPGVTDQNGGYDVFLFDRVAGTTLLVSSSASPGHTANGESTRQVISADGRYVVYQSDSTDLVPGQVDLNGKTDIFLFDRMTGSTALVSHSASSAVTTGNAVSELAVVSGDGRFVAFVSGATDLVAGQVSQPFLRNVFLWDRTTGAIALVSHALGSPMKAGNSSSDTPVVISADGSTIAFFSFASDLVAGQGPFFLGSAYAFDRASGTTTLLSHVAGSPTTPANATTGPQSISADGRYVGLESGATDLVSGQVGASGSLYVFLYDRVLDTNILVSRKAGFPSTGANSFSDSIQLSADGRFAGFISGATDLVEGFVVGHGVGTDVYLYDRLADSVSLVSRHQGLASLSANGPSSLSGISADGRRIAFSSRGTDLISGQVGGVGVSNAFIYDRLSGAVVLASHVPGSPLSACNSFSFPTALSADGAFMIVGTFATDVQAGVADHNGVGDLYFFDMNSGSNSLVSRRAPDLPTLSGNDSSFLTFPNALSADGRFIAYLSRATNLVAGQNDSIASSDVFLSDRLTRTSTLVSHAAASATTAGNAASADSASISADGRWVAFSSLASDLVAGVTDTTGHSDVFLFDQKSGTNVLVSRNAGTLVVANGDSSGAVISRDGRFVVFTSLATDLVAGQTDTNASRDVFLYDRLVDTTTLVSHAAGSTTSAGNGFSGNPAISQDGAFVAFLSGATNLVAAGRSGTFLFERATGLVTFAGPTADFVAMSEDGNWVTYTSSALNVVPGQIEIVQANNVFLFDRLGGSTTLVSHRAGSAVTTGNNLSSQPSMSADGRFLAFASDATDLAAGVADSNDRQDVFLFDRADGGVRLISAASGSNLAASNGASAVAVVSADGSRVAFISEATNLVPGQIVGAGVVNAFLYTRASGSVVLVSGSGSSPTLGGNDQSFAPLLSADGSVAAFSSLASDLVTGDFSSTLDVFVFQVAFSAPSTSFHTLSPCRVVDTRGPAGPYGAPALAANATRSFLLVDRCGIPLDAIAVSANVTVVHPSSSGVLSFHPSGFAASLASTLTFSAGQVRANNAILGLGAAGATAVDVSGSGTAHVVIDVNGYFK